MQQATGIVGPALGGVMIGLLGGLRGVQWVYLFDAISCIGMFVAALAIAPQPPHTSTGHAPVGAAIVEGLRFVVSNKALAGSFVIDINAMLFGMPRALFAVLSLTVYHAGASGTGLLYSAIAIGGTLAVLGSGWVQHVNRLGRVTIAMVLIWGLAIGGAGLVRTIVPAAIAAMISLLIGAMALLPGDIERRLAKWEARSGRLGHWVTVGVTVPAMAASGVRTAIELIRSRDPGLLGAPAWWGFDICVLWACFHAFGTPPPFTVILMCYFVGMVGNLLPLPGGLGGVEGGMIGAFAAFGVDFNLAVLAVLSYRAISFWLPTLPGAVAYFQLRRTVARWRSEQVAPAGSSGNAIEAAGPLHA